jgi:ATP-binding cassette subfamily B protein
MKYHSVYQFLWSVIKPYKGHYAIMIGAPILASFYDFANNYALKLVVDAFEKDTPVTYEGLFWPIAIFIGAQILLDLIWRIADIAEWRSEPYVRQAILDKAFSKITSYPYNFFQNTPSGSITSRIKGILDGYDNFWADMHHDFTPRIANTIVLTSVLAIVNVEVCLMVALWAITFFLMMFHISKTMSKLSFNNSNHRHAILGRIADNISNIFTIFSFATRNYESKKLNQMIEKDFIPSNIKVYKFGFFSLVIAGLFYWVMLISLFLFMIYLRKNNQVSSGDVVFVMGITLKMSWELWQLVQKMQKFMKDIGDMKSAFTIMQEPESKRIDEESLRLTVKHPSVSFCNVSFSYQGNRPVFLDLSLFIQAGEKVGLVGVSGAGKSTLVSLLLKHFHPNSGQILIDNTDIAKCYSSSVRENIAVIPQDIMLFHRTIKDNILYGNINASQEELINASKLANIHDFIMSLPAQYDSMVGERGIMLSGGQRQRIAIARAVLKNAPILILDEATASLDTKTENLIQESLTRLLFNTNTTVIAIAHRLSTLRHMDRIIVLENGKIIEEGKHDYLIEHGTLYKKLWDMQKI